MLIMDRRGRAGKIVDLVDLDVERKGHVVSYRLKGMLAEQRLDIAVRPREIIVDAKHLAFLAHEPCAQVRAKKSGTACYKNPLFHGTSPDHHRNTGTASLNPFFSGGDTDLDTRRHDD